MCIINGRTADTLRKGVTRQKWAQYYILSELKKKVDLVNKRKRRGKFFEWTPATKEGQLPPGTQNGQTMVTLLRVQSRDNGVKFEPKKNR